MSNGGSQHGQGGSSSGSGAPQSQRMALFRLSKLMGPEDYAAWVEEIRASSNGRMPTQKDIDTMTDIYQVWK